MKRDYGRINPFVNTSEIKRSTADKKLREGRPEDLSAADPDADNPDGYVGNEKGGAKVIFLSKESQLAREQEKEKEKNAVEGELIKYITDHSELVADLAKLQPNASHADQPQGRVIKAINHIINTAETNQVWAVYNSKTHSTAPHSGVYKTDYLICYLAPDGKLFKVDIPSGSIPSLSETADSVLTSAMAKYLNVRVEQFELRYPARLPDTIRLPSEGKAIYKNLTDFLADLKKLCSPTTS